MSTSTTLAMRRSDALVVTEALSDQLESAFVLRARIQDGEHGTLLVVTSVEAVPDAAYAQRHPTRLSIRSTAWVPSLGRAERASEIVLLAHTHPGGDSRPSLNDLQVEHDLLSTANNRDVPRIGTLIIGGSPDNPSFTGTLMDGGKRAPIERLRIAGPNTTILHAADGTMVTPDPLYDRQVRAFGPGGQAAIAHLRVGIVGAGGTGSAIAEQLIRLGVRDITSLDADLLTDTNVTRVYGSSVAQVDLPKVDVLRANAERIGLGTIVSTHVKTLNDGQSLNLLAHCDVVFGCTDDHAGRGWLTRLPSHALNTLIDCGVVIDSTDQRITEILGRVTTVVPGSACLFCTKDIDPDKVRTESLSADEYDRQRREGYAPELDTRDPAVVAYTTLVASLAVSEMIDRFLVHGSEQPPNRLSIRALERRIGHRHINSGLEHWCSR